MYQKKWWAIHQQNPWIEKVSDKCFARIVIQSSHIGQERNKAVKSSTLFLFSNSMILGKLVNSSGLLREDCAFAVCIWYTLDVSDAHAVFYFSRLVWERKHSHLPVPGTVDRHLFPQVPFLLRAAESSRIFCMTTWETIKLHWGGGNGSLFNIVGCIR